MKLRDVVSVAANTPVIGILDNRGLSARHLQYYRATAGSDAVEQISRLEYSELGFGMSSTDARFFSTSQRANFLFQTSLSGSTLRSDSVDTGVGVALFDVEGREVWTQDGRGTRRWQEYDTLGRVTAMYEQGAGDPNSRVSDRLYYGDTESGAQNNNLCGQIVRHYDAAGCVSSSAYTIGGAELDSTRQLLADMEEESDWQGTDETIWTSLLATQQYVTTWQYDALDEVHIQTDAKLNMQRCEWNVAGMLKNSYLTQAGQAEQTLASDFEYNAAGQVQSETSGNGIVTVYSYEPQTQRLVGMKTTRASGSLLQDLTYEHDPVGNILSISDAAQPASFFKNQHVEAANAYTYDSFYQLVTASGRESNQAVQQGPSLPVMITDPNNVVNYTRQYAYDTAGNLLSIQHHGASSYRNDIVVAAASNHSVAQNSSLSLTPADIDKGIYFDECGNSLQLQTGQPMTWNTDNQLKTVILIDRDTTEASDREVYLYDSAGGRICKQTLTQTSGTWQTQQVIYLPGLELRSTQANNGTTVNTLEMLDLIATSPAGRAGVRILHWESGQPDGIPNDQQRYSLGNQIGSVNMELDIGANILTVEEYYPFGGTAVLGAKSDREVKYKFVRYSGKERDGTGLYYYGHRYYMPWLARWLNPDPLGTSDGLNLYQMVKNNPIGLLDPNGGKSTTYEHVRVIATNLFMRKGEGGATATFRGLRIARTIFGGLLVAGIAVGIAAAASTGVIVVAALIGGGIGALAAYHAPTIAKAFAHGVSKLAYGIFGKHTTMAAAATGGLTGAAMATATGGGAQAIATGATAGAAVAAGAAFFGGDQVTAEAAGIGAGVGAGLGWALSHRPAETRAAAFEGSAVAAAYEEWSGNTSESYHIGESAALGAYYGGGFGRRIDLRIGSMYASIAGFFTQTIASSVFGGHRKVVSVAKLAGKLGALGARHYAKAATGRFERGFSWLGGGFGALSAVGGAALTAATFAASAAAFISGGWIPALAVGGTVAALGYASGVNEVINPVIDQEWGIHMEASRGHNIRNAMLGLGANAARRELNNVVHHIEGRIPGFSRA